MVEVRRRERETTAAMLRRFTRRVQQSGVLISTRRRKFHGSKPTRRAIRASALRRVELTRERIRLEKLGKAPKDERRPRQSSSQSSS